MKDPILSLDNIFAFADSSGLNAAAPRLGEAVTEAEIIAAERREGMRVPHVLRAFYLAHNGMSDDPARGGPHHEIAPVQTFGEVVNAFRTTLWNHQSEITESRKLNKREKELWEPKPQNAFFPFGMQSTGDIYFLDLRRRSKTGIPVLLLHHGAAFEVTEVAASLEEFVLEFLQGEWREQLQKKQLDFPRFSPPRVAKGKDAAAKVRAALPKPLPAEKKPKVKTGTIEILATIGDNLWRQASKCTAVAFSTDSKKFYSGYCNGQLFEWNYTSGEVLRVFQNADFHSVREIHIFEKEKLLFAWSKDDTENEFCLWSLATGKLVKTVAARDVAAISVVTSSLSLLVLAKEALALWNIRTLKAGKPLSLRKLSPVQMVASARRFVTFDGDWKGTVWDWDGKDLAKAKVKAALPETEASLGHPVLSADARFLMTADREFVEFDLDSLKQTRRLQLPIRGGAEAMAVSADRSIAVVLNGDGAGLLDLLTDKPGNKIAHHLAYGLKTVAVAPDGKAIAIPNEQAIHLYASPALDPINAKTHPAADTKLGCVLPGGGFVTSVPREIRIFDAQGALKAKTALPKIDTIFEISVEAQGKCIAVSAWGKKGFLINAETGALIAEFSVPDTSRVNAFSPDGATLLIGTDNGHVALVDVATQKRTALEHLLSGYMHQVCFSRDGRFALAADGNNAVLYDVAKKKALNKKLGQGEWTWTADFDATGRRIVVGGSDVSLRIFDATTQKEILRRADTDVDRAWFISGNRLLTHNTNYSVSLRDVATGDELSKLTLLEAHDCIGAVSLSPDRTICLVQSERGKIMRLSLE